MPRKILSFFVLLLCLVSFCGVLPLANAGHIQQLADTGILQLKDDQKWEKTYETSQGKFKVRFRKLAFASDEKKFHLIIWWNKDRIADGYCPKNTYGYQIKIFREEENDRIFVDLETISRTVLMGYEPLNKKLEKYVDSRDYWTQDNKPTFLVDSDNDLQLRFKGDGGEYTTRYKLFWDESARWFGYKDVTKHKPAPPPVYTPTPTPSYSPPEPVYTPPPVVEVEEEYEEIYYEGS